RRNYPPTWYPGVRSPVPTLVSVDPDISRSWRDRAYLDDRRRRSNADVDPAGCVSGDCYKHRAQQHPRNHASQKSNGHRTLLTPALTSETVDSAGGFNRTSALPCRPFSLRDV